MGFSVQDKFFVTDQILSMSTRINFDAFSKVEQAEIFKLDCLVQKELSPTLGDLKVFEGPMRYFYTYCIHFTEGPYRSCQV